MRFFLSVFLLTQLSAPAIAAEDCQMLDAREINFGVNRTIEGTCSNNGKTIRCSLNNDNSVTCNGPAGTHTGYDKETMIYSACGCGD